MILTTRGHSFQYEMEKLCRVFYPFEKIEVRREGSMEGSLSAATEICREPDGSRLLAACLRIGEKETEAHGRCSPKVTDKELERELAALLFRLLVQANGYQPPWGILTGIRPVKLLRQLTEKLGASAAKTVFRNKLFVSEQKLALASETMEREQAILALSRKDSASLYVSIPFCPTRCSYCSFVSSSVEKTAKLIPDYVELLCGEIRASGQLARELSLRMESVYIGGGTPTTLNADQLGRLLEAIQSSYDLSVCREFTVEAGRPDTVTQEKLRALKSGGVTRISINPQTLSDAVLQNIGRRHTTAQTYEAFETARRCGFSNINMDLIAGLPGDTPKGFSHTLSGVLALAPESITVHTLALKRSAQLVQEDGLLYGAKEAQAAGVMLDTAAEALTRAGYAPYYLYRQSRMVGNLENTGWAKPGYESCYNVFIMDETHTIFACGAGAVTKVIHPETGKLTRIFNLKYPYEYMDRYQEMLTRKVQVKLLYGAAEAGLYPLCQPSGDHQ